MIRVAASAAVAAARLDMEGIAGTVDSVSCCVAMATLLGVEEEEEPAVEGPDFCRERRLRIQKQAKKQSQRPCHAFFNVLPML